MKKTEVLIHLNESVVDTPRFLLEEALRKVVGIISPHFSPGHDHLMFVAYDPDSTSAAAILGQIHERGYGAQIVAI